MCLGGIWAKSHDQTDALAILASQLCTAAQWHCGRTLLGLREPTWSPKLSECQVLRSHCLISCYCQVHLLLVHDCLWSGKWIYPFQVLLWQSIMAILYRLWSEQLAGLRGYDISAAVIEGVCSKRRWWPAIVWLWSRTLVNCALSTYYKELVKTYHGVFYHHYLQYSLARILYGL